MRPDSFTRSDRAGDRPVAPAGLPKPPVLRRATLRALCGACLAAILYGTLGPIGNGDRPWRAPVAEWRWVPPQRHTDANDIATNVAVYVPAGVALRLLVRRRGRAGWPDLLLGTGLAAALSYATELLQQALPARSSNLTDFYINSAAAFAGAVLAVPLQRAARHVHALLFLGLRGSSRPWSLMAWLAAAAAAVLMTMPWTLRRPRAGWGFGQPLDPADAQALAAFALVGWLAAGARLTRGMRRGTALLGAFVWTALIAALLEAAQVALAAHVCSVRDALVAAGGGLIGCLAAAGTFRCTPARSTGAPEPGSPTRAPPAPAPPGRRAGAPASAASGVHLPGRGLPRLALAGLALALACIASRGLSGPGPIGGLRGEPLVQWVPFRAQFAAPFEAMTADVFEHLVLYAAATLLCLFMTQGRGRAAALLLLLGTVVVLELLRAFLAGRLADTTGPLLALLAWLLTTRLWRALRPPARAPAAGAPTC